MQHEPIIPTDLGEESSSGSLIFDRRILIKSYRKRLPQIAILTLAVMLVTAIFVWIRVSPSWKASCYVLKTAKNMSTPTEMPYLYQSFDIQTVLETVRIRDVLEDVIMRLDLEISPESLFRQIDVQRGNRSAVLRFTATWSDAEMAAQIANATSESFISINTRLMNSSTQKIYEFYKSEQLKRLETIVSLEAQHDAHRQEYGVISVPQETEVKFDQLKAIELKMMENQLRIHEMDSKIGEMNDKLAQLPAETIQSWSYTLTDESRLLELEREMELLRARYTDANPKVIKLRQDINELKARIEGGTRNIPHAVNWGPSGLQDVYTIDRARFEAERQGSLTLDTEYKNTVDSLKQNLGNLTYAQREMLEIERQLDLNRDILRIIEARLAEAQMSIQSNVSDYEIIEKALPPSSPEGGRRKLMVLLAGFLTFGLASTLVLGKQMLDPYLKSEKDFEAALKMPLIGQIPDEQHCEENFYYKNLQVLVDNILRLTPGKASPFICFGSDIPETGKSFLINDAIKMLASQGKKILYIDSLSTLSPETEPYTLNDYLYGDSETYEINKSRLNEHYAYFYGNDGIFTRILDPKRLEALLSAWTDYDLIIWELFDFAYNKQVFASIATASDALILVGRFKRSSRGTFTSIRNFLSDRAFNRLWGVLNYIHKDYFFEKDRR